MNGMWPSTKEDPKNCMRSQTFIGFVPALFYSNMFSIVFLQIKAKTKDYPDNNDQATAYGLIVVFTIFVFPTIFYMLLGTSTAF